MAHDEPFIAKYRSLGRTADLRWLWLRADRRPTEPTGITSTSLEVWRDALLEVGAFLARHGYPVEVAEDASLADGHIVARIAAPRLDIVRLPWPASLHASVEVRFGPASGPHFIHSVGSAQCRRIAARRVAPPAKPTGGDLLAVGVTSHQEYVGGFLFECQGCYSRWRIRVPDSGSPPPNFWKCRYGCN